MHADDLCLSLPIIIHFTDNWIVSSDAFSPTITALLRKYEDGEELRESRCTHSIQWVGIWISFNSSSTKIQSTSHQYSWKSQQMEKGELWIRSLFSTQNTTIVQFSPNYGRHESVRTQGIDKNIKICLKKRENYEFLRKLSIFPIVWLVFVAFRG